MVSGKDKNICYGVGGRYNSCTVNNKHDTTKTGWKIVMENLKNVIEKSQGL